MSPCQRSIILSLSLLTVLVLLPSLALAHTWECAGGDVPCLIAVLAKAQQRPDRHHKIHLGPGTFTLDHADNDDGGEGANGLPTLLSHVTIEGAGPEATIIERAASAPFFRLVYVAPGAEMRLEGLTLQGGELDLRFFFRGGGLASDGDTTLTDCAVRNNAARIGGGIDASGTLTLTRVVVEHNAADIGAGISMAGTLTMSHSWCAENIGDTGGCLAFAPLGPVVIRDSVFLGSLALLTNGGAIDGGGDLTVLRSLFLDHSAGLRGGAINVTGGIARLRQSVVSGNTAEVFGGGMSVEAGTVELRRTAIVSNRVTLPTGAGGGIQNIGGDVRLRRSTLAGNDAFEGPDCVGTVTLEGHKNVLGNPDGCTVVHE